ncbi:TetR/AcrR family transcriptional regulator [Tomitella gaofuii]|uniref:TetR/AcrR family transcriptional regulator n=1 Tax=Tomitella gaofuii TaxID=2760083 RepID=UPI002E2A5677|nr:TetR/AcrR family transcriptional regulator [Tomitella gaofuii]
MTGNCDSEGETMGGSGPSRRRGAELERAIFDAAWDQLVAEGYGRFTIEAVAARARTSKPVLYRRWRTREELFRATIRHRGAVHVPSVPDTGGVRGDLLAVLRGANSGRSNVTALLSVLVTSSFEDIGMSPSELRAELIGDRATSVDVILERARERGEVDAAKLTPRIADLPFALLRHEYFMTFRPVPEEVLAEIVDEIFLPLVVPGAVQ